jgi:hypothetical protein
VPGSNDWSSRSAAGATIVGDKSPKSSAKQNKQKASAKAAKKAQAEAARPAPAGPKR